MRLIHFCSIAFLVLFTACGQAKKSADSQDTTAATDSAAQTGEVFPYPQIPSMMTRPEERLAYLFTHYWDNYDFSDTTLLHNKQVTEQGLANQLALLSQQGIDSLTLERGIANLCRKIETTEEAQNVFLKMMDDYLDNPNSPYYNEMVYLVFLRQMTKSKNLDDASMSRLAFKRKLIEQNQPGTKANDFPYYLPDGSRRSLHNTPVMHNRLILLFYDPECPHCHEVLEMMQHDPLLSQAIMDRQLTLLAIYTEDDQEIWEKRLSELPQGWMVGSDRQLIKDKALYDLKAMPSIYLLDGAKRVILKDAPYEVIRQQLFHQ